MEKRAIFGGRMLPYLLLAPQLAVTLVFFYWPASQAVWQSFLLQDAFGLKTDFVWLENYRDLFAQPDYYRAMAHDGGLLRRRRGALAVDRAAAGRAGRQAASRARASTRRC